MARKTTSLDDHRSRRRGRARSREVVSNESLDDFERRLKQEFLCYLKAGGFSHSYCADALGIARSTVTSWLDDEELNLRAKIEKTREQMTVAGVELIQSYLIEIIEVEMTLMRETDDEGLASKIGFELLDRIGIAKINKSESVTAATLREQREVDITDKTGLLALAKGAPPHVQAKMAEAAADLVGMMQEHASSEHTDA